MVELSQMNFYIFISVSMIFWEKFWDNKKSSKLYMSTLKNNFFCSKCDQSYQCRIGDNQILFHTIFSLPFIHSLPDKSGGKVFSANN